MERLGNDAKKANIIRTVQDNQDNQLGEVSLEMEF